MQLGVTSDVGKTGSCQTHIGDVSWPAAGEHDGSSGGVEGSAHVGVASLVVCLGGTATIQLQHVHTPVCKCLYTNSRDGR